MVFWAWEKHLVWREARREEGREEGRKEGRKEERVAGRKAMVAHLERVSREWGIPMAELLPPQKGE